ncbi:hypothetical protein B0H13DRAFT_1908420 [Mycena leptocephala]|nr:hypothetical protein B0H13DRAFT_1908420 [Mycena leptocephala]
MKFATIFFLIPAFALALTGSMASPLEEMEKREVLEDSPPPQQPTNGVERKAKKKLNSKRAKNELCGEKIGNRTECACQCEKQGKAIGAIDYGSGDVDQQIFSSLIGRESDTHDEQSGSSSSYGSYCPLSTLNLDLMF